MTAAIPIVPQAGAAGMRGVRVWLIIVAALVVCTLMVGGATRLTESGLSIVEWKPVTGTIPPLTDAEWSRQFEAYKTIPQYREMNRGMSLSEFKTIFWWEWGHRLLGRLIGAVFLLPFLWFLWRGFLSPGLQRRLWIIFVLGGLQGAVGWWMVSSGLTERVSVSQYRLAIHFMLALFIFSAIVWLLRRHTQGGVPSVAPLRVKVVGRILLALVFLQLYFGALVAGLRAGRVFNTWPLIDGAFIPSSARLFFEQPWWRNFFDNTLTVQFSHRMIAYTLVVVAVVHAIDAVRSRTSPAIVSGALWIVAAMLVQVAIGILTLLNQVPIDLGLAHQAVAIVILTMTLFHVERLGRTLPDRTPAKLRLVVGEGG
ncbi:MULTISPECIES: COX15/CtaA family protein [unclassified Afipia]|uniref:COX15/CtaA family protein n=2 Tax=Afipia TaxID=1033 RepID=UPI000466F27B|nr:MULTISPECIES: COX15/CtaA family protein [unclassified Afipia]